MVEEKEKPLSYSEIKDKMPEIKEHAVAQCISIFSKYKDNKFPIEKLRWGEELESHIIVFEGEEKAPKVLLVGLQIVNEVNKCEIQEFKPWAQTEVGGWMLELTPLQPYSSLNAKTMSQLPYLIGKR